MADALEQSTDLLARSDCLEIELGDANLRVGLREQQVDYFWLVTIVSVVSN